MADGLLDTPVDETLVQPDALTAQPITTTPPPAQPTGLLDATAGATTTPAYDVGALTGTAVPALQPGTSYVTPEATVSGQLARLLTPDSAFMKSAAARTKSKASQMGMLSSTDRINLGERAAYEAAIPVATADAATFAKFQQAQQAGEIQQSGIQLEAAASAALKKYQADLDRVSTDLNNQFAEKMQVMAAKDQINLADVQARWNQDTQIKLQNLQADLNLKLQEGDMVLTQYQVATNAASQILQNTQSSITAAMQNPDLMAQSPANIKAMFNNMLAQAESSVAFIGGVSNMNTSSFNTLLARYKSASTFR